MIGLEYKEKDNKMIEYKVSGRLTTGEPFTVFAMAYNTWHAQSIARKSYPVAIKAMSAFKA
jgi:hypothetical protein